MDSSKAALRKMVDERRGLVVPGAFNAMSARVVAENGFRAVYVTGAGVTNMSMGIPDLSFIGLHEICEHTARIRDAVEIPVIVDADTGFGNPVNTYRTVQMLERAGADAIQLEDQIFPKKCGHFSGKEVIDIKDMEAKIKAAADARKDQDLMIIGRTDSAAVQGFDAAIERAQRMAEAGADILFVEAVESEAQIRKLPQLLDRPLLINIVIGGKTPTLDADAFGAMGFSIVLYANAALQGAVAGMNKALGVLKERGRIDEDPAIVASFAERQRLVNKDFYDELERRYSVK
ncbi:carboxyvinyl-carboxyphosphonate phosphorylmutase [Caballeronia mineralivorans PML1(12)]|uniref:Carboxyvinyl-carboxyphosphonate phosphorylmutase n=1 Tax=Caballeronia mineralivorans PML1(12) TaxID=908627 RepID=A0A0J1CTZ3_9BURK|nr:oxaloacetate decarboxylase [Caballeronia mineralivorans]KLU24064.1 carboxyvinyl-carboxyphosphonate phosphorylmutase [Caballeronia mineralivorans PML1(12)]